MGNIAFQQPARHTRLSRLYGLLGSSPFVSSPDLLEAPVNLLATAHRRIHPLPGIISIEQSICGAPRRAQPQQKVQQSGDNHARLARLGFRHKDVCGGDHRPLPRNVARPAETVLGAQHRLHHEPGLAGATRSKAFYRVCGTLLGACVSVALVPNLVNAPVLLSLAIASWVGFCLYFSLLDRTPRSYILMLAGYSAAIVGFPSVGCPRGDLRYGRRPRPGNHPWHSVRERRFDGRISSVGPAAYLGQARRWNPKRARMGL